MSKDVGKNITKNLRGNYSQKLLDHAKQSAADAFKTSSKRATQKTAEATGDLIGKEIVERMTKVSYISPQNNSETFINKYDKL